jgi:hypothetical protein
MTSWLSLRVGHLIDDKRDADGDISRLVRLTGFFKHAACDDGQSLSDCTCIPHQLIQCPFIAYVFLS